MADQVPSDPTDRINYLERVIQLIETSEKAQFQRLDGAISEFRNDLKGLRDKTQDDLDDVRSKMLELVELFRGGVNGDGLYSKISALTIGQTQVTDRLNEVLLTVRGLAKQGEENTRSIIKLESDVHQIKQQLDREVDSVREVVSLEVSAVKASISDLTRRIAAVEGRTDPANRVVVSAEHASFGQLFMNVLKEHPTGVFRLVLFLGLGILSLMGLDPVWMRELIKKLGGH